MFRKIWQQLFPVPAPTPPWGDNEVAAAVVEVEGLLTTLVHQRYYTDVGPYFGFASIPGVGEICCLDVLCPQTNSYVPSIKRTYIRLNDARGLVELSDFIRMRPDVDVAGCLRRKIDYMLALDIACAHATHEEVLTPPTPDELVQIPVQISEKVARPDTSLERDMAHGKPFVP